jgi:ribose transport system substrate-binding protein
MSMTNMNTIARIRRRLLSCAVLVAALPAAAVAQELNLTEAEHTPFACDASISVEQLADFKPETPKEPYTIAVSVPSFANPYIQALVYGAEKAAKEAGVTLMVGAGRGFMDPASQITQLENALSRGPDAVLINPSDPAGLAATIDDTVEAGTPVIDIGTLSTSELSSKLIQDDYTQGMQAAEALAKQLPDGGEGIVMGGPANASWARRRVAGFLDGIKATPNIKINAIVSTDIDPQAGLTKFSNAAQAHPKVDWIYATGSFLLAPQSIPTEYKDAVYIGGGFTNVTAEALRDGSARAILPDFPVSVGYIGVALAIQKLNGGDVALRNCAPVGVMTKADLDNPVWADSSIVPSDWVAPTE